MKLKGKSAIVTGAATGIGKAIARRFAEEGASVAIDSIEPVIEACNQVANDINNAGGTAICVEADISKPDDITRLIEEVVQKFEKLDIIVNNAAIEQDMPFLETPLEVWLKTITIDLTGAWICSQAAAKQMVAQGNGGRIITISSVHEEVPKRTGAPYCAAKGGLRMLTRTMAIELAQYGITANNIGPGAIDTRMDSWIKRDPATYERLLAAIPLRRMGQPEEVAEVACFLASDAAAYVTATTYFIDGGWLQQAGPL